MKVYYKGRIHRTKAFGDYNPLTKKITVKKDSIVSDHLVEFREKTKIEQLRKKYTDKDGTVIRDITFNSPSMAAAFVAGYSANGLTAWHVGKKESLKNYLDKNHFDINITSED